MAFLLWFKDLWIVFDIFNNVLWSPILNLLLSKGSYKFGDNNETLSGVMGKNIRLGRCRLCKPICYFLSKFFREEKHCIQSIDEHEQAGIK